MMVRNKYKYANCSFQIQADSIEFLEVIKSYSSPYFTPANEDQQCECKIFIVGTAILTSKNKEFKYEKLKTHYKKVFKGNSFELVYESFKINVSSNAVYIRATRADRGYFCHLELFRFIRALVIDVFSKNYNKYHGAILEIENQGIVLSGNKGAGKSSLLTSILLKVNNSKLITNDKFLLNEKTAIGIPAALSYNEDSLEELLDAEQRLRAKSINGKYYIWPQEFISPHRIKIATKVSAIFSISISEKYSLNLLTKSDDISTAAGYINEYSDEMGGGWIRDPLEEKKNFTRFPSNSFPIYILKISPFNREHIRLFVSQLSKLCNTTTLNT